MLRNVVWTEMWRDSIFFELIDFCKFVINYYSVELFNLTN